MNSPSASTLAAALRGMAVGRVALGFVSVAAPRATARVFGTASSPELDYMTRVFGARAIALGTAYLLAGGDDERTRLERLCVGVDVSDTLAGLGELARAGAGPTRLSLAAAVAITGPYAAIGTARLVADLRAGR